MQLSIIHEDDQLVVVDKPAGLSTHRSETDDGSKTLADMLKDKVNDTDSDRPGIVHRLDKDTSGLLVVAKTPDCKEYLQAQFKRREVKKVYLVAVMGKPRLDFARLEWPIARSAKNPLKRAVRSGGKMAISEYRVIDSRGGNSLLEVKLLTGRTHQIRVHMRYLGHPVLGDKLYGHNVKGLERQFLHSHVLGFEDMKGQWMEFFSELPDDLRQFWDSLL